MTDDGAIRGGSADVLQRMDALLGEWEAAVDRRAVFLSCYRMMTGNMLAAIDAGEFHDPAWVRGLLERFADYYFVALEECTVQDSAAPAAWQFAYAATREENVHVLQHLLLGINAHINYDLILCTAETLEGEWPALTEEMRQQRHADYCHVNAIIVTTIDMVQDQVIERYSPLMADVDTTLGRLDEWLITRLILGWRDRVWVRALERMELHTGEVLESHRLEIERDAVALGKLIRGRDLLAAIRELL